MVTQVSFVSRHVDTALLVYFMVTITLSVVIYIVFSHSVFIFIMEIKLPHMNDHYHYIFPTERFIFRGSVKWSPNYLNLLLTQ